MSRAEDITFRETLDWPRLFATGKQMTLPGLGREASLFVAPYDDAQEALVMILPVSREAVAEVYEQLVAASQLAEGLKGFRGLWPILQGALKKGRA